MPLPTSTADIECIEELGERLTNKRKIWILTGAGISAPSGIPTYRDHRGNWQHSRPIEHQDFINQLSSRQRYWARSMVGWRHMSNARPNSAHHAITQLQRDQRLSQLITQNVDRLHSIAGTRNVIDLHGRLDQVLCLECGQIISRPDYQTQLEELNAELELYITEVLPDGDAGIEEFDLASVTPSPCRNCNGIMMPRVIFFGGTVPKLVVDECFRSLGESDCVLVIGSSLTVYSGFRFIKWAHDHKLPLYGINQGTMRGAELFDQIVSENCEIALPTLVDSLTTR